MWTLAKVCKYVKHLSKSQIEKKCYLDGLWKLFLFVELMILLFCFLLWFCYDWESVSNTRNCVSSNFQSSLISSILRCLSYFQLSSLCFGNMMQDSLSCLMCHMEQKFPICISWTNLAYFYTTSSVFLGIRKLFLPSYVFGQCQVANRRFVTVSKFNRFIHMKTVILAWSSCGSCFR